MVFSLLYLRRPRTSRHSVLRHYTAIVRDYVSRLRECKSLSEGKSLHAGVIRDGYASDSLVANLLVQMYGKFGSVQEARAIFDEMVKRDAFSWNLMLAAYNQNGCAGEALELFKQMDSRPTAATYVILLSSCSELKLLEEGCSVHASIVSDGFISSQIVCNALLNMYTRCGSFDGAKAVFDQMQYRNVICWTSMIIAYTQFGRPFEALRMLWMMDLEGVAPDGVAFAALIGAVQAVKAAEARALHQRIIASGFGSRESVLNSLISMYGKCDSVDDARQVFDQLPAPRSVISWTAMITAYTRCERPRQALRLFYRMNSEGVAADVIAFISVVDACSSLACTETGATLLTWRGRYSSSWVTKGTSSLGVP